MNDIYGEVRSDEYLAGCLTTEDYLIDEHWNFMYEIDTNKIMGVLPTGVTPKEPRPGKSLVNFGYMKFDASQINGLKDTIELTFSIIVNPDLSLDMPMPRMSLYDFQIGSNCREFLAHEDEIQKLNGIYLTGLTREISENGKRLRIYDDNGLIADLKNPLENPEYKHEVALCQYVSDHKDGVHRGVFSWEGVGSEQQASGDCGQLYNHEIFHQMDMTQLEDCYMQMCLAPDSCVLFRSFEPMRVK